MAIVGVDGNGLSWSENCYSLRKKYSMHQIFLCPGPNPAEGCHILFLLHAYSVLAHCIRNIGYAPAR